MNENVWAYARGTPEKPPSIGKLREYVDHLDMNEFAFEELPCPANVDAAIERIDGIPFRRMRYFDNLTGIEVEVIDVYAKRRDRNPRERSARSAELMQEQRRYRDAAAILDAMGDPSMKERGKK